MKGVVFLTTLLLAFSLKAADGTLSVKSCVALFKTNSKSSVPKILEPTPSQGRYDEFVPAKSAIESSMMMEALTHQWVRSDMIEYGFPTGDKSDLSNHLRVRVTRISEHAIKHSAAQKDFKALFDLKSAIAIWREFMAPLRDLRDLDDRIGIVNLSKENFSFDYLHRMNSLRSSLMFYTLRTLDQKGIRYTLDGEKIIILKQGRHFLNRLASRVERATGLIIKIDVKTLWETGAAGMYDAFDKAILLSPEFLLKKSFLQNEVGLHEYLHHKDLRDLSREEQEIERPYNQTIIIQDTAAESKKTLRGYKHGFTVDEIRAFRVSMRVIIHEVLTGQRSISDGISLIQKYSALMVLVSEITKNVNAKRLLDSDFAFKTDIQIIDYKNGIVKISENEIFRLENPETTIEELKATYDFANFNHQLYKLISTKISQAKKQDDKSKLETLKKIGSVLSVPAIRRGTKDYPEIEQLKKMF